ncbi:expressed unknown protein [Seminavis robusta]|uniref:Uncharacterized protein n=1 Tax=Seminavis robusta TaxID=568900 RepID=A0A9N8ES87_9STRA|nr:expressed unknown protein [Seminavis robusta]|eukprot:Sro1797_g298230.1 n/a (349) ;mRNA; r:21316-22362
MSSSHDAGFNYPSGVQLPFILRKKLEEQEANRQAEAPAEESQQEGLKFFTAVACDDSDEGESDDDELPTENDALTATDLESRLWRASVALVEIQKQIHRGEETYYEDTFGHGNLFKGWEGFLDAKDVGTASSSKPPRDSRWFSSSSSISRTARPPSINTQLPILTTHKIKTPSSVSSAALPSTASSSIPSQTQQIRPPSTTSVASVSSTASPTNATNVLPKVTADNTAIKPVAPTAAASPSNQSAASLTKTTNPAVPTGTSTKIPTAAPTKPEAGTVVTANNSQQTAQAQKPKESTETFKIPKKKKSGDSTTPVAALKPVSTGTQSTDAKTSGEQQIGTKARKRKAGE